MSFGIFDRLRLLFGSHQYRSDAIKHQLIAAQQNARLGLSSYGVDGNALQLRENLVKACQVLLDFGVEDDFAPEVVRVQRNTYSNGVYVYLRNSSIQLVVIEYDDPPRLLFAKDVPPEVVQVVTKLVIDAAERCQKRIDKADKEKWVAVMEALKELPTDREKEE